jgi:hypothetical protein
MNDPIVEEVRKARDDYAARFNYDLEAMVRDLREPEERRKSASVAGTKLPCQPLPHQPNWCLRALTK